MARIVVVEDDRALRNDMADRLATWGHHVMQAGDINEGHAVIVHFRPELVLCDVKMPSGSGFALFERVSNSAKYPGMCFIFISAISNQRALDYGLKVGADDYIVKPINYGQLRASIDSHLKKKTNTWSSRFLKLLTPSPVVAPASGPKHP